MNRKQVIQGNEVSELCRLMLGGYEQYVLIEGKRKDLPIVVTLHGGPGNPIPLSVGCRGLFPVFTDRFLMVYWDQLGCGINNRKIDDTFTIGMFVDMTIDLVKRLRERFPENPIYFFATSWGSILSALALEREPKLVDGVLVSGQVVRNMFFNEVTFAALAEGKTPEKKLAVIRQVSPETFTDQQMRLTAACLRKYTNAYQNKEGRKAPMGSMIWGLMTSPDYRLKDFQAIMVNGYIGNRSLWEENLRLNLTGVLSQVQVPYVILQGDTDAVTPTAFVQELVETAENPNLRCRVAPKTGHIPGAEAMEAALEEMIELTK